MGIGKFIDSFTFSYYLRDRKPKAKIFLTALERMNLTPNQAIMVGDSLSADVLGAQRVGMKSVWYNPRGRENNTEIKPDFEVRRIHHLLSLCTR